MYGKELKLNKDKIIKLNKEFHGFVDVDDEPEFIESDLGDLIVNPNYNNELKDTEAKLKHYEDEYNNIKNQLCNDKMKEFKQKVFNVLKCNVKDDDDVDDDEDDVDIDDVDDDDDDEETRKEKLKRRQLKEKLKQYEVIKKIKDDYYNNIVRKSNITQLDFLDLSYKKTYNNVQYIQDYNFYCHEIKKLNEIIKPKIRNIKKTNENDVIDKKSIKNKVRDEMMKIYYFDNIETLKEKIEHIKTYVSPDAKPVYNIDNAFTPAFIDYFCKTYGISHYAYDINKVCFMKYVHKNQNHRALCYYAMDNHMYLVKNKDLVKSMVEKAKAPEHKIHSSMLETDEVVNHFNDKNIYINKSMESVKAKLAKRDNCIYMYSRDQHNINDIFEQFIATFNTVPLIKKCNKTNIMEFHYKTGKDKLIIFCCDPNDINTITFENIIDLCQENRMEESNIYTIYI